MVQVLLRLDEGYVDGLAKRMRKHKISQNMLAREMDANPSQVSRWFTPNDERRVLPELATVERIEAAVARIVSRQERQAKARA